MPRAMVHSSKHYVQHTLTTTTTGAKFDLVIVDAKQIGGVVNPDEVQEGASIKAVYIEMWIIGSVLNQFYTAVAYKVSSGGAGPTVTELANFTSYENKKNVFWTSQGLASNDGIAGPVSIIRGWIKIPKGKQRFGLSDKFIFTLMSRGSDDIISCGIAIFKEYT